MPATFNTVLLCSVALMISTAAFAAQPSKYEFDFNIPKALPTGDASITWSISKNWNSSRGANESINGKRFVATVMDIFEQPISQDTVETPIMHFTVRQNETFIIEIKEVGTTHVSQLVISNRNSSLGPQNSRVDSLNFMLFNGYFAHAVSILHQMNRYDLIGEVIEQHQLLFPFDYTGSREIFNSYFDERSSNLVRLPYVSSTKKFLKTLKALANIPKVARFEIYASMGDDNKITSVVTDPGVNDTAHLLEPLKNLQIDRPATNGSQLVLVVNTKKWKLINERALTNPNSKEFKLRPRVQMGPVHRSE